MPNKKMGRPLLQEPKINIVACKISDKELFRLEKYCRENNLSKSIVLRNGIINIISDNKEE